MPQEAEEGKGFARDMRRIREAHNLTVGDLHEETKIPLGLIQAFEETGLFDHPQFNRVYLRSFVRTYANVVGVDADAALAALEEALAGRYAGSLAADYLGEEPEPAAADDAPGRPAEDEGEDARTPGEEENAASASRKEALDEPSRPQEPSDREDEDREPPIVSTTAEAAASYDEPAPEEEEVNEDWAAQSPPPGRRSDAASGATAAAGASAAAGAAAVGDRPGGRRTGAGRTGARRSAGGDAAAHGGVDRRWLIAGGMIVIVAVVVWILVTMLGGESEQQVAEPVAAADTAQAEDTAAVQESAAEPINIPAIGDTMNVYIVAAQGPVDPIRVTVDDDLRRPYWIDQGDSMAFNPLNRIVVEELLDNINLKVEGIEYPTNRRDDRGRIVITRDSLENYFASLQQQQQ